MSYSNPTEVTIAATLSAGGNIAMVAPTDGRITGFTFAVRTATGANDRLNIGTTSTGATKANTAPGVVAAGNVVKGVLIDDSVVKGTTYYANMPVAGTGIGTISINIAQF
jgi:hypothetical protein